MCHAHDYASATHFSRPGGWLYHCWKKELKPLTKRRRIMSIRSYMEGVCINPASSWHKTGDTAASLRVQNSGKRENALENKCLEMFLIRTAKKAWHLAKAKANQALPILSSTINTHKTTQRKHFSPYLYTISSLDRRRNKARHKLTQEVCYLPY